ncbi:MAG: DUF4405 domain-containing protein [Thermodesulfobacteriota bacterium]
MDRTNFNFVIDALMFLCMAALAGLGFLMKYALIPGREAWAKYGRSVQLTWLGWDRHDWGQIHLYLAFILLGLLVIHIYLHWQMILGLYARLIPAPETRRRLAYALLIITMVFLLLPFVVSPTLEDQGRGGGRGRRQSRLDIGSGPGIAFLSPSYVNPWVAAANHRQDLSIADHLMPAGKTGGKQPKKG